LSRATIIKNESDVLFRTTNIFPDTFSPPQSVTHESEYKKILSSLFIDSAKDGYSILKKESNAMDSSEFELGKMMEVDSIIAQHMLELSHEDREKAYLDLHGVSNKIEETPELITRALDLMDLNIRSEHEKDAYNLAESLDATYVQNVAFRLKFLRGERFDSFMAAEKLLKHFELKKKLFGVAKLVKNITMDDMCKDSIEVLYNGIVQWLPMKDPSGRTVSILFPGYSQIKKSVECRVSNLVPFRLVYAILRALYS
jgi:hypothetical protein